MTEQQVNQKVSVLLVSQPGIPARPYRIQWNGRIYPITKVGYHHTVRVGATLFHIFSVSNDTMAFRLRLDTSSLAWILEEVYDEAAV